MQLGAGKNFKKSTKIKALSEVPLPLTSDA